MKLDADAEELPGIIPEMDALNRYCLAHTKLYQWPRHTKSTQPRDRVACNKSDTCL